MSVGAFQHDLKVGQFNESLAQKSTSNMDGVITRAKFYIKGEENNMEKRSQDAKEKERAKEEGVGIRKNTLSWDLEISQ